MMNELQPDTQITVLTMNERYYDNKLYITWHIVIQLEQWTQ